MIYLSQVCKGSHTLTHSISQNPLAVRKNKAVASKIYKEVAKFKPVNLSTYNSSL